MGDSLHINRDKIEISHELMEILGFEILVGARECPGRFVAVDFFGKSC